MKAITKNTRVAWTTKGRNKSRKHYRGHVVRIIKAGRSVPELKGFPKRRTVSNRDIALVKTKDGLRYANVPSLRRV